MRYKKDFISSEGSSSDRIKIVASVIGKISGIGSQHPPHDTMMSSLKSSNLFATPGGTKKNYQRASALNSGSKLDVEECSNISDISYGEDHHNRKKE